MAKYNVFNDPEWNRMGGNPQFSYAYRRKYANYSPSDKVSDERVIIQTKWGAVGVVRGSGPNCSNLNLTYVAPVKEELIRISAEVGFSYDPKWTSSQLGSKLIDFINTLPKKKEDKK